MHNLIKKDLEKIEVPSKNDMYSRDKWGQYSYGRRYSNHRVGDYYPWTIAKRIIEKYVGKTFDQAFAYYCTLVPKYQQHEFLEEFDEDCRHWYKPDFSVIDGIIVDNRVPVKKLYTFYSDDYSTAWKHKVTGYEISHDRYRDYWFWKSNPKLKDDDFEITIKTGWKQTFESRKDPRFVRLLREQQKRKDISYKEIKKARSNKAYCFMTKDEIEKKRLAETDELTRDRHGFDKTTFMGIEYHGQKRKRKEL